MTISLSRAKWILALVCLVLAFCLVQRSFNLPSAPFPQINASGKTQCVDDASGSEKPCALSAKSLGGTAPLLDTALPFLLLLLALMASFTPATKSVGYHRTLLFPPLRRRHLTFCVFRE